MTAKFLLVLTLCFQELLQKVASTTKNYRSLGECFKAGLLMKPYKQPKVKQL